MILKLSPSQAEALEMHEAGLSNFDIACATGRTKISIDSLLRMAKHKRDIGTGKVLPPAEKRPRFDAETREENRARVAGDVKRGTRCPRCLIVLKGSDCEERGSCATRDPDLLHKEEITKCGRLWTAIEAGFNRRT